METSRRRGESEMDDVLGRLCFTPDPVSLLFSGTCATSLLGTIRINPSITLNVTKH